MSELNRYQAPARKAMIANQGLAPSYFEKVSKMDRDARFAEYKKLDQEIVDRAFVLLRTTDATEFEKVVNEAAKLVLQEK